MKKIIVLFSFLIAFQARALPKLSFTEPTPTQFTFEITNQGLGLIFLESKGLRRTELKPKYTVSDAQKIVIVPQKSDRLRKSVELLLVVLSQGSQVQTVQVFIPTAEDKLIQSSQTEPICEFKNFGDFSWEKPADLNRRVRLIEKGKSAQLELKIGQLGNSKKISSVQPLWKKCFSF